jgi:hypothetical protein
MAAVRSAAQVSRQRRRVGQGTRSLEAVRRSLFAVHVGISDQAGRATDVQQARWAGQQRVRAAKSGGTNRVHRVLRLLERGSWRP